MAQAEAAKTYYSPWTGMQGQTVMPPSAADAALKWGATGAMMGANIGGNIGGPAAGKQMAYNTMSPQGGGMDWMKMQQAGYNPQMMS